MRNQRRPIPRHEWPINYFEIFLALLSEKKSMNKEEKENTGQGILIADDCEVMQHLLKGFLNSNGYRVVGIAANGEEAVRLYERHSPSLVTMDINMPVMDGLEATRKIKEIDPDAKIIMVSIELEKSTILKAIKSGADEYIAKPIQSRQFLRVIEHLLSRN